jgi:5'-nucleotidase
MSTQQHADQPPLILLTNDDGINSPGLGAAASALDPLGEVLVVAPHEQQSGTGRSMPLASEGRIFPETIQVDGQHRQAFAVQASPAQAVQHGIVELAPRPVSLVVSGINYGENLGTGITISGTVGAALEGASFGVPSLAISLQTDPKYYLSNDGSIDFSIAAHFTRLFARILLTVRLPIDVDVLKVDVPRDATPRTPWRITHLSRKPYYIPIAPTRERLESAGRMGYRVAHPSEGMEAGSDVEALHEGAISVTPLSLDMTSRVAPDALVRLLSGAA